MSSRSTSSSYSDTVHDQRVLSFAPRSNLDSAFPPFPDKAGGVKILNVYKLAGFDVNSHNYNYEQRVPLYSAADSTSYSAAVVSSSKSSRGAQSTAPLFSLPNSSTQAEIGLPASPPMTPAHTKPFPPVQRNFRQDLHKPQSQPQPTQMLAQTPQMPIHRHANQSLRDNMHLQQVQPRSFQSASIPPASTPIQSMPVNQSSFPSEQTQKQQQEQQQQRLGSTSSTSSSSSEDCSSARESTASSASSVSGGGTSPPNCRRQKRLSPPPIPQPDLIPVVASPRMNNDDYSSSDDEMHFSSRVRILSQMQMTLSPINSEFGSSQLSPLSASSTSFGRHEKVPSDVSDDPIPNTPALNLTTRASSTDSTSKVPETIHPFPHRRRHPKHRCTACNLLIEGRLIRAPRQEGVHAGGPRSKRRWHRECFKCTVCQTPFDGLECYLSSDSQMPFCGDCYHKQNGSLCFICGSGVEGSCVIVKDEDEDENSGTVRRAHTDCFKCSECAIVLNDCYYEMQRGEFMCEVHAVQAYNKFKARAFVSGGLALNARAVASAQKRMSRIEKRLSRLVINSEMMPLQPDADGTPF